ncbi:MAG: hypothetical protein J5825_00740 [Lachnospiraceae bacterium]|nr:hypothetical protein [Lachnospiraceae bacterium]
MAFSVLIMLIFGIFGFLVICFLILITLIVLAFMMREKWRREHGFYDR